MWKASTCSLCSLGSHVVYGVGRSINRRIRRSDRNPAGAPQKPMWRKVKPKSAVSH